MKYGSCKLEWVLFPGAKSRVWPTSTTSFCSLAMVRKKCQRDTEIDRLARSSLHFPLVLSRSLPELYFLRKFLSCVRLTKFQL